MFKAISCHALLMNKTSLLAKPNFGVYNYLIKTATKITNKWEKQDLKKLWIIKQTVPVDLIHARLDKKRFSKVKTYRN